MYEYMDPWLKPQITLAYIYRNTNNGRIKNILSKDIFIGLHDHPYNITHKYNILLIF